MLAVIVMRPRFAVPTYSESQWRIRLGSFFTLPQGGSLRRNDEAGRGTPQESFRAEWSAMDGAEREGPPRSFLAPLPRGG